MRKKQQGFAQIIILAIAVGIIGGSIAYDKYQAHKEAKLQKRIVNTIIKDYD